MHIKLLYSKRTTLRFEFYLFVCECVRYSSQLASHSLDFPRVSFPPAKCKYAQQKSICPLTSQLVKSQNNRKINYCFLGSFLLSRFAVAVAKLSAAKLTMPRRANEQTEQNVGRGAARNLHAVESNGQISLKDSFDCENWNFRFVINTWRNKETKGTKGNHTQSRRTKEKKEIWGENQTDCIFNLQ